jgi:CheY-like chemotaxis protein
VVDYLSHDGKYDDQEKYPLPFVIFLDLKLPYLDGFEILSWIKQQPRLKSIVVVVLTGSSEARDHQKAYALGARSYLVKPPKAKDIRQFIDSMTSYWGGPGGLWPVFIKNDED